MKVVTELGSLQEAQIGKDSLLSFLGFGAEFIFL